LGSRADCSAGDDGARLAVERQPNRLNERVADYPAGTGATSALMPGSEAAAGPSLARGPLPYGRRDPSPALAIRSILRAPEPGAEPAEVAPAPHDRYTLLSGLRLLLSRTDPMEQQNHSIAQRIDVDVP
jgi:hypothetical protein